MAEALVKLFEDPEAAEIFRRSPIPRKGRRQNPAPCQFKINHNVKSRTKVPNMQ